MKTLLFALLTLLMVNPLNARADEPKNFCYTGCSQPEQVIWQAFEANEFHASPLLTPSVYSGACYHSSPDLDNTVTHYGMVYLDQSSGNMFFNGEFSFFYDSDPYAGLTPEQAKKNFSDPFRDASRVYYEGKSAEANFSTDDMIWMYWMRFSPDLSHMYLVAAWSASHEVFCDLIRH